MKIRCGRCGIRGKGPGDSWPQCPCGYIERELANARSSEFWQVITESEHATFQEIGTLWLLHMEHNKEWEMFNESC